MTKTETTKKKFIHEVSMECNSLFGRAEVLRDISPERAAALEFIARAASKELQDV